MRIVIDLQACQSTGSRTRGIGRYSIALAQAMVRQAGKHEVWLLLNDLFPDTIAPIRQAFAGLVPQQRIRVWHTPGPVAGHDINNTWRRRAGEMLREQVLAELRPDIVHVSSLFEGFTDDALTNVGALPEHLPTAVTLYDLIPLVYASHYLAYPPTLDWYYRKLNALKNADLLLAISEATRLEGLALLHMSEERIVNISSAVSEHFQPGQIDPRQLASMQAQYGLTRPFVMYTGGIDHRKNIEGLIRAFAALPPTLRLQYQLAIVCSAQPADSERLQKLARQAGLGSDEVLFTGFVPDEILPMLYNTCALFVFPSWHEGFGLPALEAMACGAPVIAANTSSLPEVIGRADAMFDPRDDHAITAAMVRALTDTAYRDALRSAGLEQAKKFSWDASAKTAIAAFENFHARSQRARQVRVAVPQHKPKLAFLSPLPPDQSGIADYCAELLPELAQFYDIEIIVRTTQNTQTNAPGLVANFVIHDWRWFDANAHRYDRVMYHFGNSDFHGHMFELLERHPGVVVLHDFFMSGILAWLDARGEMPGAWARALYDSHGYHALLFKQGAQEREVVMKYPCNAAVLNGADGIIVHADYSKQLARQWYGEHAADDWAMVPLLRKMPPPVDRAAVRQRLGLQEDDFLVASFGILAPTKLNHRLLRAWLDSPLARDPRCRLLFVGQNDGGEYGAELLRTIAASGCAERISITGFADPAMFRDYLVATDVAVQLRTLSRGETSAAVLDCMAHGKPTIINAHAAMDELPAEATVKLADTFTDAELAAELVQLHEQAVLREILGSKAARYVATHHAPAGVVARYVEAIETFAVAGARARRRRTISAIATLESPVPITEDEVIAVAASLSASYASERLGQILVDVGDSAALPVGLTSLLASPPPGFRIEPVRSNDGLLRYARALTCSALELASVGPDDVIDAKPGDIYVGRNTPPEFIVHGLRCVESISQLSDILAKPHADAIVDSIANPVADSIA